MLQNELFDVAVVGAGPAGSSVAIRLAMAGLRVIIIEKAKFPREKLCGEFISPECLDHFSELGIEAEIAISEAFPIRKTVFYGRNGKCMDIPSDWFGHKAAALGLSRSRMDKILLDRAHTAGVSIRDQHSLTRVISEGQRVAGVCVKDKTGVESLIKATITVDATGRSRVVSTKLKRPASTERASLVAFKTHLDGAQSGAGSCEIYSYPGGYGGCNRVENGMFNLCFIVPANAAKERGGDADRVLRELVFKNARAKQTLENAASVRPWLAVPISGFGRAELSPAGSLLAVGDAASFIDPFTGSGILMALESGRIAAEAIIASFKLGLQPHETTALYKNAYGNALGRRLRISSILRRAAFVPFAADAVIGILNMSSGLRRNLARATR